MKNNLQSTKSFEGCIAISLCLESFVKIHNSGILIFYVGFRTFHGKHGIVFYVNEPMNCQGPNITDKVFQVIKHVHSVNSGTKCKQFVQMKFLI